MTRVAVLGTGRMGGAIAKRLQASGYELTLWDRTRQKAEALQVGRVVATPREAVRQADLVISSLTGPGAVREIYLAPDGVLPDAAGKVVVEMSTAGPEIEEELGRLAQAKGVRLVESPVVGSVPAVLSGTLVLLVGGAREDLEVARPVLEHLGEIRYAGGIGNGSRLKLIANSMLAITSAAAAELLGAGRATGLPSDQVFWILARFVPALNAREAGFLRDQHEPTMFAVRDLVKDLGLALDMDAGAHAPAPLTSVARDLFDEIGHQYGDFDISVIVRHYLKQPVSSSATTGGGS